MRQYVFDDDGLRALLENAYKHGYVSGIYREPPKLTPNTFFKNSYTAKYDALESHLDGKVRCADMNALIAGESPYIEEQMIDKHFPDDSRLRSLSQPD